MSKVLEKYFHPDAIKLAFYRVKRWPDRMVKDQIGINAFGVDLDENSKMLSNKIIGGTYKPQRGFKFYQPKAALTSRTKTMLYVEDALVYQAIANAIGAENYDTLQEQEAFVFGSILNPEVKKGLSLLEEENPNFFFFKFWKNLFNKFKDSIIHNIEVDKVNCKFETDITGFFDCIPHYNLLMKLSDRFNVENEILDLLSSCLNIWSGTKDSITPGVGIPQGPLPSFLFANMLLHDLDDLIIGEGFKYYRYMDDIKIYGYQKEELVKALVLIDKYLKGNGLSINAKKTNIEPIVEGEDKTLKELKKLDLFSSYEELDDFDDDDIKNLDKESEATGDSKKEIDIFSKLSDQENNFEIYNNPNLEIITEPDKIIDFLKNSISEVEIELPKLFIDPKRAIQTLQVKEDVDDIDFIRLSAQYGTTLSKLDNMGFDTEPNTQLLKFWLFAYKKYFWRVNNFGLTIMRYKNNKFAYSTLFNLIDNDFQMYEWAKYHALQTLSLSHSFTDRELRQNIFKMLQYEESDLVKISLYRLLFKHSINKQFTATVKKQLQKESSQYLKMVIADFNKNQNGGEIDIVEFINSIGL